MINKTIANNTLFLYFRMLLSMIVTLYTSRIVLQALGLEDFGIYNVVGGIVVMLSFFNYAMTASTQRFLAFSIGEGKKEKIKEVFSTSLSIHFVLSLLILLLSETLGVWVLNNNLNIPLNRLNAANWVFQSSVFLFVFTVLSVPYHAAIIAYEKMRAFAAIGVIEVFFKYLVAVSLPFFWNDRLITYAVLLLIVGVLFRVIYILYCFYYMKVTRGFIFFWNYRLINEMGKFAGWNILGVAAGIIYNQGVNILLNIFFGPAINGARAISFQVQSAVNSFVTSFQTAVNPAITKLYAQGDLSKTYDLVISSSKLSFYLLSLFTIPLIIESKYVLFLWLGEVPSYTVIFTQLILIDILIGSFSNPLQTLIQATGKIRIYQIIVSGILLFNLPISFVLLKLDFDAQFTVIISIILTVIALFARLIILNNVIKFPTTDFFKLVIFRAVFIFLLSFLAVLPFYFFFKESLVRLIAIIVVSSSLIIFFVFIFGLNKIEKNAISNFMLVFFKKKLF